MVLQLLTFALSKQADKIKANEAKLHAADEKKSKVLADVKDKVWNVYGT